MSYAPFGAYWVWANQSKVTFDGDNRLILINPGVTGVLVEADLYSNWKEWAELYDYMKYPAAMRNVGGDPINTQGDKLGATFFLINGWKIRTWEGDHILNVVGNLYSDDAPGNTFVPTLGSWNITVNTTVSNLIDKTGLNTIPSDVWDQLSNAHTIPGSKGKELRDVAKIIKILLANS